MPVSIGGYSPIPPILPTTPGSGAAPSAAGGADFGSSLKQAVGALGQLGAQADASSLSLAKGEPIDIHEVMLNTEQASLGFSMALQVRNKLVDAYTEVMRMSV
jgi:flagellar hook-basal body complex protein FliE